MKKLNFKKSAEVGVPVRRLWDWHMNPGAFERLAPAWRNLVPVAIPDAPVDGARAEFFLKAGPFRKAWIARIGPVEAPYRFIDTQEKGPFASWRHEHRMDSSGDDLSRLTDTVTYSLPAGLGNMHLFRKVARSELERLFHFRHQRMVDDLRRFPSGLPGSGRGVLVTGSTGLIGRRLVPYLRTLGFKVKGLSRNPQGEEMFRWNPTAHEVDLDAFKGVDAVIHLAGENIAGGRWTESLKTAILQSRVDGTRTLVEAMERMSKGPDVLISASGVNYYKSDPSTSTEDSGRGTGFLSDVCEAWEDEALKARDFGSRVVCVRTGIVLDPLGGALGKMLPAFRLGLGGPIGSGKQGFPWIAMDDLLDVYVSALLNADLQGPVNAVHPERVSQGTFSHVMGKVLHRPAVMPLPAFMIKALLGQMGKETLLGDLSVHPEKLIENGFEFRFPDLEQALSFMLGKSA